MRSRYDGLRKARLDGFMAGFNIIRWAAGLLMLHRAVGNRQTLTACFVATQSQPMVMLPPQPQIIALLFTLFPVSSRSLMRAWRPPDSSLLPPAATSLLLPLQPAA